MNNFIFENATKVYFGKGCVKEYLDCLKKAGLTIVEFSGIGANPTYAKVLEGAGLARESRADSIFFRTLWKRISADRTGTMCPMTSRRRLCGA